MERTPLTTLLIPNPLPPNLPCMDLVQGPRLEYLRLGVSLYEASIKRDWKAANAVLVEKPELVRYSITENGDTALHVAASAKGDPKLMVDFVNNLVGMMTNKDLELQNANYNTALYLAAAAGNVETVKIMMKRNRDLLTIIGAGETMLPLCAAALYGHYDAVKFIYKNSNLDDCCWTDQNRGWLFEICVDNDMFDIGLSIMEKQPEVANTGSTLQVLARKPKAFYIEKPHIISRFFILGTPKKETKALLLLREIWEDIVKKPKREINNILRGPPEPNNKQRKAWCVQVTRLQVLLSEHRQKLMVETNSILSRPLESSNQAIEIQNFITKYVEDLRNETQNIIQSVPLPVINQDNETFYGPAKELDNLISTHIVRIHEEIQDVIKRFQDDHDLNFELKMAIGDCVYNMDNESERIISNPRYSTYSSRVLFIAAEVGNVGFLIELLRQYPDLIWKVNDKNRTIFHIGVKHRHEDIYNLLYEIGSMKDMITPLKDHKGNNMLHLAGKIAKGNRLENATSGAALQMQRELVWFHEVESMVPPSYRYRNNEDGLTPYELFSKDHKDLVREGD
ncbi:uncharacterized protein [Rutidosis leptorrhynchoides]|uniref:uncharacterized protein n=1 Tax=Rutidosis leptorrhynchoides TaxID=125765 RepID=UPI003A990AE6